MIVVYHVASMGNWMDVVSEQLNLLVAAGLTNVPLYITHVGKKKDAEWTINEARALGLDPILDRQDSNILHYETFAMILIERLALEEANSKEAILYFHTKGVSNPGLSCKTKWRKLMEREVILKWKENLKHLENHDAVGVNWCPWGDAHFSGNFWIATVSWIRQLPNFSKYHNSRNLVRTNCEFWIGSTPGLRAKSLVCSSHEFWKDEGYDWDQHFRTAKRRLNLGCGDFPIAGFTNVDVRQLPGVDLVANIMTHEFEAKSASEIYCGHFLEHVADPLGFLRRCHYWLDTGATLTVTVPHFGVASAMYHSGQIHNNFTGDRIAFGLSNPPEQKHLQAFTPVTLVPLMEMAGFRNVRVLNHCAYWVACVPWQFSVSGIKS